MKAMLVAVLATSLMAILASQAEAARKKHHGYGAASSCAGRPGGCAPARRAARPAPGKMQRGYLPARRGGPEYDFPRFGSERWWQLQEDRD